MFIRKRDPRYKAHLAHKQAVTAAKASAKSSGQSTPRKQPPPPATAFVEQTWQKSRRDEPQDADLEWAAAENEDEEEWECVACGKTFRSEAAWDSHERSKKHMQAVERLRREMMEEDEELGLDGAGAGEDKGEEDEDEEEFADANEELPPPPEAEEDVAPAKVDETPVVEEEDEEEEGVRSKSKKKKAKKQVRPLSPPLPELLSKSQRRARVRRPASPDHLAEAVDALHLGEPASGEQNSNGDGASTPAEKDKPEVSKRDKRRAREAAKKAKEEREATTSLVRPCNVDGSVYRSCSFRCVMSAKRHSRVGRNSLRTSALQGMLSLQDQTGLEARRRERKENSSDPTLCLFSAFYAVVFRIYWPG